MSPDAIDASSGRPTVAEIPGLATRHAIITPDCRINRGSMEAFEEAVSRCRHEYLLILQGHGELDVEGRNDGIIGRVTLHLVLTMEREADRG